MEAQLVKVEAVRFVFSDVTMFPDPGSNRFEYNVIIADENKLENKL